MYVRVAIVASLLLGVAVAGCASPDSTAPNRDVRDQWRAQRDAHGPLGVPATFNLTGQPLYVLGDGAVANLPAPFDFFPAPRPGQNAGYLFFENANVSGKGSGFLVLEATTVHAAGGAFKDLKISRANLNDTVALYTRLAGGLKPSVQFPPAWADASMEFLGSDATGGAAKSLLLSNYTRAALLAGGQATNLTGALNVTATNFHWSFTSWMRVAGAQTRFERFGLGGLVTGGSLIPEGRPVVNTPLGVFGLDAALLMEPKHVQAKTTFRLTQALTNAGLLLPAQVEVVSSETSVSLAHGEEKWVSVSYREKSYIGDAVLKNVQVTGSGQALIQVPLKDPQYFILQLWQAVLGAGWAAPFLAIPLAVATPWILIAEVLTCAFSVCPQQYPYPIWMGTGSVDVFYFKVNGDLMPGEYDATITFEGQNYSSVKVPIHITIT